MSILTLSPRSSSPVVSQYVVHDFSEGQVPTPEWVNSFPAGTKGHNMSIKSDGGRPGTMTMSIAAGQGRDGSNALALNYVSDGPTSIDGFWIISTESSGVGDGGTVNPTNTNGYMIPWDGPDPLTANPTFRPTALDIWVKFPPGFRVASSAIQPPTYPNARWGDWGNYYATRAGILAGWHENNNWHYYYHYWFRSDLADLSEWQLLRFACNPTDIRSWPLSNLTHGPTRYVDGFSGMEQLTRWYFEFTAGGSYVDDPEIAAPYTILIDSIVLVELMEDEPAIVGDVVGGTNAEYQTVSVSQNHTYDVTLTNTSGAPVTGYVSKCAIWRMEASFTDPDMVVGPQDDTATVGKQFTFAPGETKTWNVSVTPSEAGSRSQVGVQFVSDALVNNTPTAGLINTSNPHVENRTIMGAGPFDSVLTTACAYKSIEAVP